MGHNVDAVDLPEKTSKVKQTFKGWYQRAVQHKTYLAIILFALVGTALFVIGNAASTGFQASSNTTIPVTATALRLKLTDA